ncbi:MAG: HAD hydrolase-like protein [Oscillochloridaceae bacterium umkhey_bin13]
MNHPPYPAVLFDLDGTLTDPYQGITRSFIHTLTRLERPLPDEATLRSWIGPPLGATLQAYLGDAALAEQAVQIYRQRYRTLGMYENQVYPGIPELLNELQAAEVRMVVATSKLIGPAEGIIEHFGLAGFFSGIVGATPDNRISAKRDVIAAALDLLPAHERTASIMVGDTAYDIEGAHANNLPCLAVSYGYGTLASLEQAAPKAIAHSVAELRAMLLGA